MSKMETPRLVCLDMDRVLVDHLSTWQFVYDNLGISNDESFELYNQGLLDEWDWIKLDIALIKQSRSMKESPITDSELRGHMEGMPMMKNWREFIQQLLDDGYHVAIVSGGLQQTARDIAAQFPSQSEWKKRWGGIDRFTAQRFADGMDTQLHVFTNGWLLGEQLSNGEYELGDFGRYQVQMDGKGSVVQMLQRRLGVSKSNTASVGDSAGDIAMFQESGFPICFNPWDDRPKPHAHVVIEEKDLMPLAALIADYFESVPSSS
ncbi:HAD hydrolase family protein [Euryarchaeota archaeon]|nr:HAD hydrolase family protein [Euryarchaeota archaeon]MDC0655926.1 HAD hydrolase family protein [Candidatus Poseidoniaceae archaeon]MDA8690153.1 HAD hydrolase family protein [Euryarchaeota archaeon]MDA8700778.1 HAD hydrolase family protein [Euryarchaeota archaeon]MDA8805375.1 HAD hydrolase family protein [Euryarchaeota archaeon]